MTIGRKTRKSLKGNFAQPRVRVILSTGEILRILRKKNEFSQGRLAMLSGLTQATISSLESNRVSLGVERAKALALALHVHPAVLLFPNWKSEAA